MSRLFGGLVCQVVDQLTGDHFVRKEDKKKAV